MTYGAFLQYLKEGHAVEREQVKSAMQLAWQIEATGRDKYLKQLDR